MRLTLVIPSLSCGGVERVVATMANYWVASGNSVTLLTFDDGISPPFYQLSSSVAYLPLNLKRFSSNPFSAFGNNLRMLAKLRAAIRQSHPDVAVSFIVRTNVRTLLATRGLNIPVIVSERADPQIEDPGRIWTALRRITYRLANRVVAHTRQSADYLGALLKREVVAIPNPLCLTGRVKNQLRNDHLTVIAAGRLEKEKGFDVLLESFARVAEGIADLSLKIFGEGSQREELERMCDELSLRSRVTLPGQVTQMQSAYEEADLFVAPSRLEGFGNAICEAMACGLPVIATQCAGPGEIITSGANGVLVPVEDVDALTAAMQRLLTDIEERGRLATSAIEVNERFGLETVMSQWNALLDCAGGRK